MIKKDELIIFNAPLEYILYTVQERVVGPTVQRRLVTSIQPTQKQLDINRGLARP